MKPFLLLFVVSISLAINAQEEKKTKFRYLSIDYGMLSHPNTWAWHEFVKVKDKSEIVTSSWYDSLSTYNFTHDNRFQSTFNFQIQAGFNVRRKEDSRFFTNPKLMLGLKFYSLQTHFSMSSSLLFNYDTLTSSQTGQQYFLEKQRNKSVGFENNQAVLQVNLGYQTNLLDQRYRINPYLGIGIGGGVVYRNISSISYLDSETTNNSHNTIYQPNDTIYSKRSEDFRTSGNYILNSEVKAGVDFHIKKLPAWKLFIEYKFGILALNSGEIYSTNFSASFQMGVQLDLWKLKIKARS